MGDQCLTDLAGAAMDQAEHAFGHAGFFNCGFDGLGNDFGRAGVGRVALEHDRATGGQCRCGVTARGRKCQREVRRTKNTDRAKGLVHDADVGLWQGLTIRLGGFNAGFEP